MTHKISGVRHLTRFQIVARLKRLEPPVRQADIAEAAGCSQGYVNHVLSRHYPAVPTETSEKVWREVERHLGARPARRG